MGNPIIELKNISKHFPGVKALDNISFSILEGEVHCLLGSNGAGKSTLIKTIMGIHSPNEGEIFLKGEKIKITDPLQANKYGIAAIYQELSLVSSLSVFENIFLGDYLKKDSKILDWNKMKKEAKNLLSELGTNIKLSKKVSSLSRADQQMVEIAKALRKNSEILILDEPTATLTKEETNTLFDTVNKLSNKGITIIYISHKLEEILEIGDKFTVLRDGKYITTNEVDHNTNINHIAELMVGDKVEPKKYSKENTKNNKILEVKNVSNKNVDNISFNLYENEVLGFYGLVGSGRTELLKILFGIDKFNEGEIKLFNQKYTPSSPNEAINKSLGLIPENRKEQALVLNRTVWENIIYTSFNQFKNNLKILDYTKINTSTKKIIDELNIKSYSIKQLLKNLSGGNQQKVAIGKWVVGECEVLLFDEPTQGIDVGAKEEIYKLINKLTEKGKSVIVVSSELNELLNIASRIIVMHNGKIITKFNYSEINKQEIERASILGEEYKHGQN